MRDISATHRFLAEWTAWLRLPATSGLECVAALRLAGFRIAGRPPGCVELRRDDVVVQVPLADRLGPEVLIPILIRAHVGPAEFLRLFDASEPEPVM